MKLNLAFIRNNKRFANEPLFISVLAFVCASMVIGGAPSVFGVRFFLIFVLGLFLLFNFINSGGLEVFGNLPLAVKCAVFLSVVLPFIQIMPLPPELWTNIPGHELRRQILNDHELASDWLTLSITPIATSYSALISLFVFSMFFALFNFDRDTIFRVLCVIMIMIVVSSLVGVVQFASDGRIFSFYNSTHRGSLIGFFSNKNHMGLLIACGILIGHTLLKQYSFERIKGLHLLSIFCFIQIILLAATSSRAGFVLGLIACGFCFYDYFEKSDRKFKIGLFLSLPVAAIVAAQFPVFRNLFRRIEDVQNDLRGEMIEWSRPLIDQYFLTGAGIGSFVDIFTVSEKLEWVGPSYVNHVHNDYLEFILEAGIFGAFLIFLWAIAILSAFFDRRRTQMSFENINAIDLDFQWLGFLIVGFFVAHSFVDYPIRRLGTLVVLIVGLALIFRPLAVMNRK